MSRERAERRARELGPPHKAWHAGFNRWQVILPGEGGELNKVIEQ